MGSRILLYSLNQYDFPYPVFPLGAAQVDAALQEAGHVVRFVDYNVNLRPVPELVREFKPDYVGISLRNIDDVLLQKKKTFFDSLLGLVSELRQHSSATIVLGGSGFSIFPEELLQRSGADFGIQGEGEGRFPALIDALENGRDHSDLPGLVYQRNGGVQVNRRSLIDESADIPIPDISPEIADYYIRNSSMLNLQTQRGCALKCCYCTYPLIEGHHYRQRSPESVAEELARMEAMGARYVFFVDSVFNTSHAHVTGICEAILSRGIKLKWCCFLRPKRLTRELVQLMARAGLSHIEFGSDSFSDPVLQSYGKGLAFADILESAELAAAERIDCTHFLILGGPGETADTLEETFANSKNFSNSTLMARAGMRVYPGTPLFHRLAASQSTAPPASLLEPFYYIAPPLTEEGVLARLTEVAAEMPNWIHDDPPPEYFTMTERLRAKGVIGPLWSYFAMVQKFSRARPS